METAPGKKRILSIWGLSFPIPAAARTGEAPPEGHQRQLLISGGSPSLLPQVAQPCSSFLGGFVWILSRLWSTASRRNVPCTHGSGDNHNNNSPFLGSGKREKNPHTSRFVCP